MRHVSGLPVVIGGGGGIRTRERLSPLPVFKTGAFNHSATPPRRTGLKPDTNAPDRCDIRLPSKVGIPSAIVFKTAALNRSATLPDACRGGIWGAPEEGVNWTLLMSEAEDPTVPTGFAATGDAA